MFALTGGADICLPGSAGVVVGGFSLAGGRDEAGSQCSPRPRAPLVRT